MPIDRLPITAIQLSAARPVVSLGKADLRGAEMAPDALSLSAVSTDPGPPRAQGAPPAQGPPPAVKERLWSETLVRAHSLAPQDTVQKLDVLITGLSDSDVLWRHIPPGSPPGGPNAKGHPYDLDGARTAAQIVKEGRGGSCGSFGKVLADALVRTGTSPQDVFLVDTVGESERRHATRAAKEGREAGASGHQFLLVRDRQQGWLLVDTTAPRVNALPFASPEQLMARLSQPGYAAAPVRVRPAASGPDGKSVFPNLVARTELDRDGTPIEVGPPPAIFGDLVLFGVQQSSDYHNHRIGERVRAVARVVPLAR